MVASPKPIAASREMCLKRKEDLRWVQQSWRGSTWFGHGMREKVFSTCLCLPFSYEMGEMGLQSHASEPEMKEHQCHSSGCATRSCSKAFCHFAPRGFSACCLPGAAVSSEISLALLSHPVIPLEREKLVSPPLFPEARTAPSTGGSGGGQVQTWCRANDFSFFCCSFISLRSPSLPVPSAEAVGCPFCGTNAGPSPGGDAGT